jgi:dihydrolipoamide dehydrogenase
MAEVTVVEVLDRVLPVEDDAISALARKSFEKEGIRIHTGATVRAPERSGENVVACIEGGGQGANSPSSASSSPSGSSAMSRASGSKIPVLPSTEVTSSSMNACAPASPARLRDRRSRRPAVAGAQGDAHKGVICVERISGVNDVHPLDLHNNPSCAYCRPQVASVALTEKAARKACHEVKIGHCPFIGKGKAIALGGPKVWLRRFSTAGPASSWGRT